jgi:hypothetical protein
VGIEDDILQVLDGHRGETMPGADIAAELGKEVTVIEGYLDRLEAKGEVELARKFGGCDAVITPLGVVRVYERSASEARLAAGEVHSRLQEQLDNAEELIGQGASATLEDIKEWVDWTRTVIKRCLGEDSERVSQFQAVMNRPWRGPVVPNLAGYRERLPEWRRLLKMWIREIDEFETPSEAAEQYIRPGSQLDAYAQLKDTVERASTSLVVVDPYVDHSTLQLLLDVNPGVSLRVLTVRPSKDFAHAVDRFREQWRGTVEARVGPKELHDRFVLLDDRVFVSGASIKDIGERGSTLVEIHSEVDKAAIRRDVDKAWEAARPI